jgi:hypothetical protein
VAKISAEQIEFQARLIEEVYLPILRLGVRDEQSLLRTVADLGGLGAVRSLLNDKPVQVGQRAAKAEALKPNCRAFRDPETSAWIVLRQRTRYCKTTTGYQIR